MIQRLKSTLNQDPQLPTVDTAAVVNLAIEAWAPVFASFARILGDDLYQRVHPDWEVHQAAAVGDAPSATKRGSPRPVTAVVGFVNVIFNHDERAGEIYMIAVDPDANGTASLLSSPSSRSARCVDAGSTWPPWPPAATRATPLRAARTRRPASPPAPRSGTRNCSDDRGTEPTSTWRGRQSFITRPAMNALNASDETP